MCAPLQLCYMCCKLGFRVAIGSSGLVNHVSRKSLLEESGRLRPIAALFLSPRQRESRVAQVKPDNILVTTAGDVKVIDFGAAVDMCTGAQQALLGTLLLGPIKHVP